MPMGLFNERYFLVWAKAELGPKLACLFYLDADLSLALLKDNYGDQWIDTPV